MTIFFYLQKTIMISAAVIHTGLINQPEQTLPLHLFCITPDQSLPTYSKIKSTYAFLIEWLRMHVYLYVVHILTLIKILLSCIYKPIQTVASACK